MTNSKTGKNLRCYHCGYEWTFKGNQDAPWVRCPSTKCRRNINVKKANMDFAVNVLSKGNLIETLNEKGKNKSFPRDYLLFLLGDDETVLALNKACEKRKRTPEKIVRMAVVQWLKKEGYL